MVQLGSASAVNAIERGNIDLLVVVLYASIRSIMNTAEYGLIEQKMGVLPILQYGGRYYTMDRTRMFELAFSL